MSLLDRGAERLDAAPPPPRTPDDLTAPWISRALAAGGRPGAEVSSVAAERIGEGVGVLAELYRLTLTYAPGSRGPASVIAKLHASAPEVRELCDAYGIYPREIGFYREVAGTIGLRTPHHYFSAYNPVTRDCVILMEDLAPAASPDQVAGVSLGELTAAIDGVATLHARWWGDPRLETLRSLMPSLADPPYSHVAEVYRAALAAGLEGLAARGHLSLARTAEKVGGALEPLLEAMSAGPRTLCHGDFRVDNLMFRNTPAGSELTVIDWQVVMQARGPLDIGYLMGGAVPTELRRAEEMNLLRRYHGRLTELGVTGYGFEDCLADYRRAVLISLVYWIEGFPLVERSNARAVALFDCWAARLAAAVPDLDLEALLGP